MESLKELAELIRFGQRPAAHPAHPLRVPLARADLQLEQEVESLAALESSIGRGLPRKPEFQRWSQHFSTYLLRSPKREIFERVI